MYSNRVSLITLAQYLRIAYLQGVFLIQRVVPLGLQCKLRYAVVGAFLPVVHVAQVSVLLVVS